VTYDEWKTPYALLCAARGWREDAKRCRAYFDALEPFSLEIVKAATLNARSRVWDRGTKPTSSDLVEICRMEQRARHQPEAVCDLCGNEKFTFHVCDADVPGHSHGVRPCGVRHAAYTHDFVRPCAQCHPASLKNAGAA